MTEPIPVYTHAHDGKLCAGKSCASEPRPASAAEPGPEVRHQHVWQAGRCVAEGHTGTLYNVHHDRVLDGVDAVLREQFGVGPEGDDRPVNYEDVHQAGYAITAAVLSMTPKHDSDCQAFGNTYAHQGEPGLFLHGNHNGRHFAADAVGTNGRRILVRDDADGIYVGGALLDKQTALNLSGLLHDMAIERIVREAGQGADQ